MKIKGRTKSVAIVLACAAVGSMLLAHPLRSIAADGASSNSGTGGGALTAPATQPTQVAPARDIKTIYADYMNTSKKLSKVLPPSVISDSDQRTKAAAEATPLEYKLLGLVDELAATKKLPPTTIDQMRQNSEATLYLLNDAPTVTKVNDMKASSDSVRQLNGESVVLYSQWLAAANDKAASGKVINDLEKLDKANPDSSRLTMLTLGFVQTAHSQEEATRLIGLITDVMTDPYATKIKTQIATQKKAQEETEAKQKGFLDKPFVIASKTVDGKDFTTEDMKGKVILVDFWATWCGPCRASLPHVKETYAKYHDKGLEIVGIDNDYDTKSVTTFTAKEQMPWTQLYDADAAANHQWNSLSAKYGVNGIPCMFLIDKKGVLRSVTARADMDDLIPKLLAE
jgi:thiol-disulfide isomerase/thioredoxin